MFYKISLMILSVWGAGRGHCYHLSDYWWHGILWWQTFPRLLNAGDLSLHFALGPPTPTSAVLNLSKLDMFYMSKTPKRV